MSAAFCFTYVHPRNVEDSWPTLGPWVAQGMADALLPVDINEVKSACMQGTMQLLVIESNGLIDTVLVVEHVFYFDLKVLSIRYASGRLGDRWMDQLSVLEAWARTNGIEHVMVSGRKGWERKMKPAGYKLDSVNLIKDIRIGVH